MIERFSGLYAAVFTPFDRSGELDLSAIPGYARHLERERVAGVFVAGTTGECHSLMRDERIQLADAWTAAACNAHLQVLVHVGSNCQRDACAMAAAADRADADGVAAMAPFFFRPTTVQQLVDYLQPIVEAAGDRPFFFYDIPQLTGVQLPMVPLLEYAADHWPTFAGLKYSHLDLVQLQECVRFDNGRFDVLFGCDEALLAGEALGTGGAVGSTYNFAAALYHEMLDQRRLGNHEEAQRLQARSVCLVRDLARLGFLPAAKTIMALAGVPCGAVRPPLVDLSGSHADEVARIWQQFLEGSDMPTAATGDTV